MSATSGSSVRHFRQNPQSVVNDKAICLVCSQTYNSTNRAPFVTCCGHTFCRECVLREAVNNVFKCFICRSAVYVSRSREGVNAVLFQILKSFDLLATDDIYPDAVHGSSEYEENFLIDDFVARLFQHISLQNPSVNGYNAYDSAKAIVSRVLSTITSYEKAVTPQFKHKFNPNAEPFYGSNHQNDFDNPENAFYQVPMPNQQFHEAHSNNPMNEVYQVNEFQPPHQYRRPQPLLVANTVNGQASYVMTNQLGDNYFNPQYDYGHGGYWQQSPSYNYYDHSSY